MYIFFYKLKVSFPLSIAMNTALFSITVCFLVQSILPVKSKFFIIETEVGLYKFFSGIRESQSKTSYDRKIGLCNNPETMDKKSNMKNKWLNRI